MSNPILVTGAAGGAQGSTGRLVASLLLERGLPVRALVHRLDSRSDELRQKGAEVVEGDLLDAGSVQAAMRNVKRAYFTYPVAEGLLESVTIFAAAARAEGVELVVNNSQFQGVSGDPAFATSNMLPASGICSTGWPTASSTRRKWARFMSRRRRITKTCEHSSPAVSPNKIRRSCRGGKDTTVIPLAGAEDVARVAASLLANAKLPSQNAYPLVNAAPTVKEMIEALARAIGRPVRYVSITDEQWANAVRERINPHALDHLTHLWQYFRKGGEHYQSTDTVRATTGRNPQTLEEFFRENARFFAKQN